MSEIQCVTAILTKAEDVGENDRLVRLFTMEGGMLRAKIRGVKKPKAKLKFAAQPFAFCKYDLAKRGAYYTVTSATQIESLIAVTYDEKKYLAGCVMLEISDVAVDEIKCPELFVKLLKALKTLIYDDTANPYLVAAKYAIAALAEQGYGGAYTGKSSAEKLLETLRHTALVGLKDITCDDNVAANALKRAANDCEYYFDKRIISADKLL